MKILLVNPSGGYTHEYPPLGLLYIAAVAKKAGHVVEVYDQGVVRNDKLTFWEIVESFQPDVCGWSLYTTNVISAFEQIRKFKIQFPKCLIVVGGPHATAVPELTMEEIPEADFLVYGEGEITFLELLNAYEAHRGFEEVTGLYYRKNGKALLTSVRERIDDLDTLPFPAIELVKNNQYGYDQLIVGGKVATVVTSRGCPFTCAFCNKMVFGAHYTRRSPKNVADEIELLINHFGYDEVYFMDDLFAVNPKWLDNFFAELESRNLHFPWKCLGRVDTLGKEDYVKLQKNGCYLIQFGVESGNQEVLRDIDKHITIDQVRKAFSEARDAGLLTYGFFIFGHHLDTHHTIKMTMNLAKELNPDFVSFFVLVPFPGTKVSQFVPKEFRNDWKKIQYVGWDRETYPISICHVPPEDLLVFQGQSHSEFYGRMRYLRENVYDRADNIALLNLKTLWWKYHFEQVSNFERSAHRVFVASEDQIIAEELVRNGLEFASQKNYQQAMDSLERAHAIRPLDTQLLNDLGVVYYWARHLDLAQFCFKRVLEIEPENEDAKQNLADFGETKDKTSKVAPGLATGESIQKTGLAPFYEKPRSYKIGMITTYNQRCGLAVYAKNFLSNCDPDGFLVLAERTKENLTLADESNVVRCWSRDSFDYSDLMKTITGAGVKLVHVNYHPSLFQEGFAQFLEELSRNGIRIIVTFHTTSFISQEFHGINAIIDAAIVHLPENRNELIANGCDPEKIVVIPMGIPKADIVDLGRAKASMGVSLTTKVISTFGFIEPHKGILEVIQAVAVLKNYLNVVFLILGSVHPHSPQGQPYFEQCQKLIHSLGLEKNVIFASGYLEENEVLGYLQASDVIVMNYTSNRYEASAALGQALSVGRPIVTSGAPMFSVLADAVMHVNEAFPLAQALFTVLTNPFVRASLIAKGREYSLTYEWPIVANMYKKLYGEVAFGEKAPVINLWERYNSHPDHIYDEPMQRERIEWLRSNVQGKVLEVGCATGFVLEYVGGGVGIDIDRGRLEVAKRLRKNCTFQEVDVVGGMPFSDREFDTVIVPEILEHIPFQSAIEVLKECLRVGRRVLITIPNAGKQGYSKELVENVEHLWFPTPEKIEEMFAKATPIKPNIYLSKNEDFILVVY